ncbi:preprotein translocase subunit SecG [Sphingobacterium sp. SRCM116780]|uniref:preprotein translocase subunit SecG n=1 Tax=Sphingobacterium sp. SRCM116780 TaxID=2907623 RepID=UPI001F1EDE16|nr:preprotein translocase subunit SecG [Sphingobacterium sp. SRCM116780]UIR55529.1 preprotein translocase subunit SecG [Sphingobacterium sp. SRCM116780]
MQGLLIALIILASILLSFLVLIQNPKGGGLSSGFAGGTNIMGVKRTGDFLEKGSWGLVIAIMIFCLAFNIVTPTTTATVGGGLGNQIEAPAQSNPLNLNNTKQPSAPAQQAPVQKPVADSTK